MNVLILDNDKQNKIEVTKEIINLIPSATVLDCETSMQAYKAIIERNIDLVITELTSEDGAIDGFDVIKQAKVKNENVESIIITHRDDLALKAYDYQPRAYNVKPVDPLKLTEQLTEVETSIAKLKRKNNYLYNRFVVQNKQEYLCVPYNDILFFETHSKKTKMHYSKQSVPLKRNLTELENELPSQFVRIHKSYIANVNNVSKITEVGNRSYEVSFYDSEQVALMSRYKAENFFKIIKEACND